MSRQKQVICIVGPTACHKSELSVMLAERISGEIVSADSVSVYRGLDIGSAKPTEAERRRVPHHMIDCVDITDTSFSVASFQHMARQAIDDIYSRNKIPIIVGGSGLYVDAILCDFDFAYPSDAKVRKDLENRFSSDRQKAYVELEAIDSDSASRLNPNDYKRIIRALEVYYCSGKPMSSIAKSFSDKQEKKIYDSITIGLCMERDNLYQRINDRVELMMQTGLLSEVKGLYDKISDKSLPAMQSIGYAQLFRFLDGEYDLQTAVELIKRDTRRFAKRQLTWFRRDKSIKWLQVDGFETMEDVVTAMLDYIAEGEHNVR